MFKTNKPARNQFDSAAQQKAVDAAVFKIIEANAQGREWVAESWLRTISGAKEGEPLNKRITETAIYWGIQIQ